MSLVSVGLGLIGALFMLACTLYLGYLVLARLVYWGCVGAAIIIRLGQTPAEARNARGWQGLAADLFEMFPMFR